MTDEESMVAFSDGASIATVVATREAIRLASRVDPTLLDWLRDNRATISSTCWRKVTAVSIMTQRCAGIGIAIKNDSDKFNLGIGVGIATRRALEKINYDRMKDQEVRE